MGGEASDVPSSSRKLPNDLTLQHYCPNSLSPIANPDAVIVGTNFRFTVLTPGLIRYEWALDGVFEDRASTLAINRNLECPTFQVLSRDEQLEITTAKIHVTYDGKRPSPNGLYAFVKDKEVFDPNWRYGNTGAKDIFKLYGTARTLDEVDGRCKLEPSVISRQGITAIDDSRSMLFDSTGWICPRRPGDRVDGYIFAYGLDFKASLKAFYSIAGKQPEIPRWALGNWWSRNYAYSDVEYLQLLDKFASKQIPLSIAVLDMDWHLVDDLRVTHNGWTGYTWNEKLFPDPEGFLKAIHARNLKVSLNEHPAEGVHDFEEVFQEFATTLGQNPAAGQPVSFNITRLEFLKAYLDVVHSSIERKCCDFWWIDWQQGEESQIPGVDPLWILNHFYFLNNQRNHPDDSPLILSRYAGPGSHRYPVGFSGDTVVSWASLQFQPEFTASASNIGFGWWSHDIGGHMFGTRDDELYVRWIQLGVFSPIMRLHSMKSQWMSKEPWLFRAETEAVVTHYLQLRHRLLPYLYAMNTRAATEDEPLIQPMYYSFPTIEAAYKFPNQYYFGSELIVAPITHPRNATTNLASCKAWLPRGRRYVDILRGIVYDGGRELRVYRPLSQYPVLAQEGSIIPLDAKLFPVNGDSYPSSLEVMVAVGRDGRFAMTDSTHNAKRSSDLSGKVKQQDITISYHQASGKLTGRVGGRPTTLRFMGLTKYSTEGIHVEVDNVKSPDADIDVESYPATPSVLIKIPQHSNNFSVILGEDPKMSTSNVLTRIHDLLLDFQIELQTKESIWEILTAKGSSLSVKVTGLLALDIAESVRGPICEVLMADSTALL